MTQISSSCGLGLACGLYLGLGGGVAMADATDVVVQADNATISTPVAPGSPVHIVSLGRRVAYGDINFNVPGADAELVKRLAAAAAEVCGKLDAQFPGSKPDGRACAQIALKEALRQVHAKETAALRTAGN